jgi:hypothetical protein
MRVHRRAALVTLLALAAPAAALAAVTAIDGPRRARVGQTVDVRAGEVSPGVYRLSLVAAGLPRDGVPCVADLGPPVEAEHGEVELRGRIPRRLPCWSAAGRLVGRLRVRPGSYRFVVGQKLDHTSWNATTSFRKRPVTVIR